MPLQNTWMDVIGGSRAQKDLLDLLLIQSVIRGNQTQLANQLLEDRIKRRPVRPTECQEDSTLVDRLRKDLD